MEKFLVTWTETVEMKCSVIIEAKNEGHARGIFDKGEYDTTTEEKEEQGDGPVDTDSIQIVPYEEEFTEPTVDGEVI